MEWQESDCHGWAQLPHPRPWMRRLGLWRYAEDLRCAWVCIYLHIMVRRADSQRNLLRQSRLDDLREKDQECRKEQQTSMPPRD